MLDHLLGSRHHLDEAGRALGEQSSVPTPDHELVPCPFAGVRRGGRMNRGALAQVQGHHDELVRLVDGLWGPPTVAGAWTRCAHLTLTAMAHPPPVPVRLAAAFKTFLGFRQVLGALAIAGGLALMALGGIAGDGPLGTRPVVLAPILLGALVGMPRR